MSDGSSELFFRDPATFTVLGTVTVSLEGEPVTELNELECLAGEVYANVWQTDEILRIDKASGDVLGVIDASDLLSSEEAANADVLNGIAYDAERRHFFITGKLWPWVFEVEFEHGDRGRTKLPSGCGCFVAGHGTPETPLLLGGLAWLVLLRRFVQSSHARRLDPS
jgi:hypothetical protein